LDNISSVTFRKLKDPILIVANHLNRKVNRKRPKLISEEKKRGEVEVMSGKIEGRWV